MNPSMNMQMQMQMNPNQYMQNKGLDDTLSNNAMLNGWLSNIKNSNMNLYENMVGQMQQQQSNTSQHSQQSQQNNNQNAQMSQNTNFQDPQNIVALLQQINLYKEILAQVSYQNQLLGRNISGGQNNQQGQQNSKGNNSNTDNN